jgi:hypothetical protein
MKRSLLALAALCVALGSTSAQAATFTWESTNEPGTAVGTTRADGVPFMGLMWKGKSDTMMGGKKIASTFTCISMSQPENDSIFNSHVICDVSASDGNYTLIGGCTPQDKAMTKTSCVAGLYGKTGVYAGKRGNLTSLGSNTAASGTGQWFD